MNRVFNTSLILLFATLFVNTNLFPQTHISAGKVSGVWQKDKSPYYINGEIRIAYGDKLVIEPGVEVIFSDHYKFEVYGTLVAMGTPQDSILFTAGNKDEKWGGIRFNDTPTESILQYCIVEYGWAKVSKDSNEVFYGIHPYGYVDLTYSAGGGIFIYYSSPKIRDVAIRYCQAEFCGGGIWSEHSEAIIENCYIFKNSSKRGAGGIDLWYESNIKLLNCIIEENSGSFGGGIRSVESKPEIRNCIIVRNRGNSGGGIQLIDSYPIISDCIIRYNSAISGGGIMLENSEPILTNLLIEKNKAFKNRGGIQFSSSGANLSNVTVRRNNASEYGGGIYFHTYTLGVNFDTLKLCNIYLNTAGLNGDDLFLSYTNINFRVIVDTFTVLNPSKPCVEPIDEFDLNIINYKIDQVQADLYVNPQGSNNNSGLSPSEPLKTIKFALLKILPDSLNPLNIYLSEGIYSQSTNEESIPIHIKKYVSLVSDSRADITWTADSIVVSIPWWNTNTAIIAFVIFVGIAVVSVWRFQQRRIRIRNELERQKFEAKKLHEVDDMKSRFFANISHEFRTPLTLIFGLAKKIVDKSKDPTSKDDAGVIKRNANRLNGLVNQLLDLSKLESGNMDLRTSPQKIIPLLKGLVLSFASFAERKSITLKFNTIGEEIIAYLDKDKIEKIITNLLSNAFKFTPEGGRIDFDVKKYDEDVQLIISDTGIGISKKRLDKIFDRFYQVDGSHTREQEGTGLGLALTKELVELHKGQIKVESEEGKGSKFTITLPLGKDHLIPEEIIEDKDEIKKIVSQDVELITDYQRKEDKLEIELITETEKPLLLIVEDNTDVRNYIKGNLEGGFRILEAVDGKDGLRAAFEYIPDLIISDVMMPMMDGFEMCDKIKKDERTSHIPIIMLTAKATSKDKIEGYETGADDYIMKPFEATELQVRIKNLIDQRRKLREHFRKEGLFEIGDKIITSIDKRFLSRAIEIIHSHISDTTFSVDIFSDEIGMSRSQLLRKLTALVGESPSDLIRRIRLSKAAKLIEEKFGNISEIAIEVGFSNPANFSRSFGRQFGVSPSEYEKRIKS